MPMDNTELIQRLIDITVALFLVEGSLHADAIVIGREHIALELGGSALERATKQELESMFGKLMECRANSDHKNIPGIIK